MVLTPKRHQVVDATLFEIQEYLVALSKEIEIMAPPGHRRGATWVAALEAEQAIGNLRQKLRDSEHTE